MGFGEKQNNTYGISFVCTTWQCEKKIYDFSVYLPFKVLNAWATWDIVIESCQKKLKVS